MATPLQLAAAHRSVRVALKKRTVRAARKLWRNLDRQDLNGSWQAAAPLLYALLANAQRDAASEADSYLATILGGQDIPSIPAGDVVPDAFSGIASDGRDLASLLYEPVIATKAAIGRGATVNRATAVGEYQLMRIVGTQVADAGRVADGVAAAVTPDVSGYVRMLVGESCSRCIVLAGRWYRWNQGFRRHPLCNCVHIPTSEAGSGDLMLDPEAYFESLSKEAQDRIFTKDGAQAIRDGADIGKVVNARRGMSTAAGPSGRRRLAAEQIGGRDVFVTREGVTRRSRASRARTGRSMSTRLMPESIYQVADGRDDAIRLLRLHGYII